LDKNYNVQTKTKIEKSYKPRLKGIYPYDFTDSWDKFSYKDLITKEEFCDSLNNKSISEQEYKQYKHVWNSFSDVYLGNYSDLYLKLDILTLADVFEVFRETYVVAYSLDPAHSYSTQD
jgi:hypothetical protein